MHRPGGGYLPPGKFSKTRVHRIARREPLPTLEEYVWPTAGELDFFDEDDELRAATDAAEFELLWSDGWIYGSREDDDFEIDRPRPSLAHLDDFDDYVDPYDFEADFRW